MRSLGPLALLVVVTGAAHAAVPSVRRWSEARTARVAERELGARERALAACLVGPPVEGAPLVDRLVAIETALLVRGEGVGNDDVHWPGRCAPLVRSTVELIHLGRSEMRPWEVEALGLVLGGERPLGDALRVAASLTALPVASGDDATVDALVASVGGRPPLAAGPELTVASLPIWARSGSVELVPTRVDDDRALARGVPSGRKSGRAAWWADDALVLGADEDGDPAVHTEAFPDEGPPRRCRVRAGGWLLDACTASIHAIPPHRAAALEDSPWGEAVEARFLGSLDAAPHDVQGSATQSWTRCHHGGQLVAVAIHPQVPWQRARVVPIVDGEPGAAVTPEAPVHQIRCDDGIEVTGVREVSRRRFLVQRDRCRDDHCAADAIGLDAMEVPPELQPEEPVDVAVASLGDEVVVVWRSPSHGVFFKRGPLEDLPARPLRWLTRATGVAAPSAISAVATGSRAVFVLTSFGALHDHAVVAFDTRGGPTALAMGGRR